MSYDIEDEITKKEVPIQQITQKTLLEADLIKERARLWRQILMWQRVLPMRSQRIELGKLLKRK